MSLTTQREDGGDDFVGDRHGRLRAELAPVLACWGIGADARVAPLGNDNVLRVEAGGRVAVLKRMATESLMISRTDFLADVLDHVAACGVRVAAPRRTLTGAAKVVVGDYGYVLHDFIEGDLDTQLSHRTLRRTGAAIAGLHQALASYPDRDVAARTWREDVAGTLDRRRATAVAGLSDRDRRRLEAVLDGRMEQLRERLQDLPEQLIHRDCHAGNIVLAGGDVVGFIDCDHICLGPPLFDLTYYAANVLKWTLKDEGCEPQWPAQVRALVEGYTAVRALTVRELGAIGAGVIAYHVLLIAWFLDTAQPDLVELDLRALEWLHNHPGALAEIAALATREEGSA